MHHSSNYVSYMLRYIFEAMINSMTHTLIHILLSQISYSYIP